MDLAINSYIHRWMMHHPFVAWIAEHPVISLVVFLVAAIFLIRLFVAIYKLIMTSIDRLWLWILRSPFLLLKALFGWEFKPKTTATTNITNYELTTNSEQLEQICDRLDRIQQQQQKIIQDLALLKQNQNYIKETSIELIFPESKEIPS